MKSAREKSSRVSRQCIPGEPEKTGAHLLFTCLFLDLSKWHLTGSSAIWNPALAVGLTSSPCISLLGSSTISWGGEVSIIYLKSYKVMISYYIPVYTTASVCISFKRMLENKPIKCFPWLEGGTTQVISVTKDPAAQQACLSASH